MKHIKTLTTRDYKESMKKGGCGECQTSCQSACKTSCTVGNQSCENTKQQMLLNWHFTDFTDFTIKENSLSSDLPVAAYFRVAMRKKQEKERMRIDTSI